MAERELAIIIKSCLTVVNVTVMAFLVLTAASRLLGPSFRAATLMLRRSWFGPLLMFVFVCGMVHYGATKGDGGNGRSGGSSAVRIDGGYDAERSGFDSGASSARGISNLCFVAIVPHEATVDLGLSWSVLPGSIGGTLDLYTSVDLPGDWIWTKSYEISGISSLTDTVVKADVPGWESGLPIFFRAADNVDSDGDLLSDAAELWSFHTNPRNPDSDGDGYDDGWEVAHGFDPNDASPQIEPNFTFVTNVVSSSGFGFHDMHVTQSHGTVPSLFARSSPLTLNADAELIKDGLPQIARCEDQDRDNEFSFSMTGFFTPPTSGDYTFVVAADDNAVFTIGDVTVSASWVIHGRSSREASGWFRGGVTYPVSFYYDNNGAYHYFLTCGYYMAAVDDSGDPRLVVDPKTVKFSVQAGEHLSDVAPAVSLVGTIDPDAGYTVETDAGEGLKVEKGSGVTDVKVYPDAAYAGWDNGVERKAVFRLMKNGEEIDSQGCVFICEGVKEKKSSCCCDEGTETDNGCVSFSQAFGRSPAYPGIPSGRIVVFASRPTPTLYTPAALRYDHPMMRRIRYLRNLDARIVDGLGKTTEYIRGIPGGVSSGGRGQLFKDAEGHIVEELEDGLRVIYDASGSVAALQSEFGLPVPVSSLGITVNRAPDGTISSVVSAADGTMTAISTGPLAWRLSWTSPSGQQVKRFDFGGNGVTTFTLREYRSEEFQFDTVWTYDATLRDFNMTKGGLRNRRSMTYDPASRSWNSTLDWLDENDVVTSSSSVTLERDGHEIRAISRRDLVTGRELYSSTLDSCGRIASETDSLGAVTTYLYDRHGRVTNTTMAASGVPTKTIVTEYSAVTEPVDFRPVRTRTYLDGVLFLEEEFEYGKRFSGNRFSLRSRTCSGVTRISCDEYDANGRKVLSVSENGCATRTIYAVSNGCIIETSDDGVIPNWGCGIPSAPMTEFAVVDGGSLRTVRVLDSAGNAVRVERYAFVEGAWRPLDWETHVYNPTHKVTASAYSDGTSDAADWICAGPVFRSGRDGVTVSNEYDSAKQLSVSVRYGAFGAVRTDYVRDNEGRVIREISAAANCETQTVSRVYDSRGRIVSETDAHGVTTLREYSVDDLTNVVVHADGGTVVTVLNSDGSIASVAGTAALPEYRTYSVTGCCRVVEVRYGRPDSPRFSRVYTDGFGETVRIERSGFNGSVTVMENEYDGLGNLVRTTESGKPESRFAYDVFGVRTNATRIVGNEWRAVASSAVNVLVDGEVFECRSDVRRCSDASIPALSIASFNRLSGLDLATIRDTWTIDERGNTNRTISAADPTRQLRIDRIFVPGVGNVETNISLDGHLVTNVSHSAVVTKTEYDAYRRAIRIIDGRGNARVIEYDAYGRQYALINENCNRTTYGYDAVGNVIAVTNALTNVIEYAYNVRGNKTYEGGATYPVSYSYDIFGNKVSMTTYHDFADAHSNWGSGIPSAPSGDTTRWYYDESSGSMTNKVYADGNGTKYEYDALGRLTKRTWARGIDTTYTYDAWGSLTRTDYSDTTPSVVLTYDAMGRQTSAIDAAGTTIFAYDAFGSLINETVVGIAGTNTIERFYDTFGRDAGYALNGIRQSTLAYEPATGRLVSMRIGDASSNWGSGILSAPEFAWSYLPGSDLKSSLSYPNGVTASWTYGNRGELLEVNNVSPTGTISKYVYTYDAAGRRTGCDKSGSAFDTSDTNSYLYNARSELTNATAAVDAQYCYAYAFDDIGNRKTSAERGTNCVYMANNLNQYTIVADGLATNLPTSQLPNLPTFQPVYDADGNQTLVKTATGIWSVTYNGENRPILWTQGTNTIVMSFDRMGRRVSKNDQRFVYDGYLQIAEFTTAIPNSSFLLRNSYVWDPTEKIATRPLVWNSSTPQPSTPQLLFYTHDGNKNVSEVIAVNGIVAAHYEYAPFGALTAQRGTSTASNLWRFSSEYAEDDTATVYYNYRHYEPLAGRWMSRDPIGERGGIALYGIVENNTLNTVDRYGCDIWIENTGAALGFHWRICVDEWMPAKKGTCCRDGIWWKKTGRKFCISFGAKNRVSGSSSSAHSGSSSGSSSSSNSGSSSSSSGEEEDAGLKKDSEFPAGIEGDGTNGIVYIDEVGDEIKEVSGPWGDVKGIIAYKSLDCKCDGKINDYLSGLVGMKNTYGVLYQNCRDFSQAVFDKFSGGCPE